MSSELILPELLMCGYYDSSLFSSAKVTPKRRCTMVEVEHFLEDGKNIFLNNEAFPIRKTMFSFLYPEMSETANFLSKQNILSLWQKERL